MQTGRRRGSSHQLEHRKLQPDRGENWGESSQEWEQVAQRGCGNSIPGYTRTLMLQGLEHPAVLDLAWTGGETGGPSRVPPLQHDQCCDCPICCSVLLQWWCVPFSLQKVITTQSLSQGYVTLSPTQTTLYLQQFAYLSQHLHKVTEQLQTMLCPQVRLPYLVPSQILSSLSLQNWLMTPILPFGSFWSILAPESCLGAVWLSACWPEPKLCKGLS